MKDQNPEAAQLARELFEARRQLRTAGRALHDDAGSLLSSAGLRLQLLRMDVPPAAEAVSETLTLLDQALERVRVMSQELNSSPPAHLGFQAALSKLISHATENHPGTIRFSYAATVPVPPDAGVAMYDAVAKVLEDAFDGKHPRDISISVNSGRDVRVKVVIANWRWRKADAAAQARRAAPAKVVIQVTTKKSTIVSIRYALRRPSRG